jgi:hypothetical protein
MLLEDLIFDKNKITTVNQAIEDLCFSCAGLDKFCSECPADQSKKELNRLAFKEEKTDVRIIMELGKLIETNEISFNEITFEKNKILMAQNAVEDLCFACSGAGILCSECTVHQARRTLASLPVKENDPYAKKVKKTDSGAAKGGSCGTSCSTGCGTKKK